jgi:acyl-CoA synthetase (AMP-forming)/AMP-acid ligase II
VITELGVPGEICIKGHNMMRGYYYIVDRKKDMVTRSGFNVYPREIEQALPKGPAGKILKREPG